MADTSKIEWTDSTFNPWVGCTKVSPACDHCYAQTLVEGRFKTATWGAGRPRVRTTPANWRKPLRWNAIPFWQCESCRWRGDESSLDAGAFCPGCATGVLVPARRRVFCASLADVFDNEVDPQWLCDLFDLIRATPNLDWLLLTKRIGNLRARLEAAIVRIVGWHDDRHRALQEWLAGWLSGKPPANVWIGATVVNQAEADRDIPKLLATPAARRFLSIEPMLGPVDLRNIIIRRDGQMTNKLSRQLGDYVLPPTGCFTDSPTLDWVICGGESGPNARPMHPDWPRHLRDQCAAAGVPFFFKQWGEYTAHDVAPNGSAAHLCCIDPAGRECALSRAADDPWWFLPPGRSTWYEQHRIPAGVVELRRVGKKAAGRLLDGRTHDGFPEPRP